MARPAVRAGNGRADRAWRLPEREGNRDTRAARVLAKDDTRGSRLHERDDSGALPRGVERVRCGANRGRTVAGPVEEEGACKDETHARSEARRERDDGDPAPRPSPVGTAEAI
jgi:hypothetical protein